MKKGFDFFSMQMDINQYDLSSIIDHPPLFEVFIQNFKLDSNSLQVDKFFDEDGDLLVVGCVRFRLSEEVFYLNKFLDPSDIINQWEIAKEETEWKEHQLLRIALLGQAGFGGLYLGCGKDNGDQIWVFNSDRPIPFKKVDDNIFNFVKRLEFSTDFGNLEEGELNLLCKNWSEDFWRMKE